MLLCELIERLEDLAQQVGPEAEVRLMTQKSWPFENTLAGCCTGAEINACDGEDGEDDDDDVADDAVVYLVEGYQIGYGSERAWELCE